MKLTTSLAIAILPSLFVNCQREIGNENNISNNQITHPFVLSFNAVVSNTNLIFNKPYQNVFGEQYAVTTFKYYIGNIQLTDAATANNYAVAKNTYFLVDASDSTSSNITMQAPAGNYNTISFTLGVDSTYNVSGAQSGALDPANGMFWTWNTGYIMAKLEATSPLSHLPNNRIQFHIGGFKTDESVIKNIALNLPQGQPLSIQAQNIGKIIINADVNAWFANPHNIRIADTAVCMTPGTLAKKIADNYANMFTINRVTN